MKQNGRGGEGEVGWRTGSFVRSIGRLEEILSVSCPIYHLSSVVVVMPIPPPIVSHTLCSAGLHIECRRRHSLQAKYVPEELKTTLKLISLLFSLSGRVCSQLL